MVSAIAATGESARARMVGWAFALAMIAHTVLIVILPRLDKESAVRDMARGWHYVIGITLLVLAIWRLVLFVRERGALSPAVVPPALRFWHHALVLGVLLLVVLGGPLGFLYGWAEGRELHLAGLVTLPQLMGKDHAVWQFSGYFHSATANATVFLALAGVLSAAYGYARYGIGIFSAFPAGFGVVFLVRVAIFIYALNSFAERRPGFIAAGIFIALVLAFWLIVRAARAGKFADIAGRSAGWATRGSAFAMLFVLIGFGLTMPYLLFRVTPFATGVMIEADPSITWHQQRMAQVALTEPTQFELTTGQETYKWCKFCHTMKAGEAHLLGPNLNNIFGQRAATVPNFHYSPALAQAGQEGLVWTEETIRQYIAGPDEYVPGTSMIISSGPVTDPAIQQAVINALKRDTMGEPAPEVAAR